MVIDHGRIQNSRSDYFPTKAPYDAVVSFNDFMLGHYSLGTPSNPRPFGAPKASQPAPKVETKVVTVIKEVIRETTQFASYLKPTGAEAIKQNEVIFKAKGLDFLRKAGVYLTELDGVYYLLDTASNSAEVVTAQWAMDKGLADLKEGKDTPFTQYLIEFQLITEVTFKKPVEA